ncbi:OLC1v1003182C1 [Oldenlandia corymbosa var. corymbosa]|uniref:OLC1v1003182C1 n=1 Tax=Oldenlandia corymbosa var. corymbosa TaxID=529605 RepID=A0AAV1D9H0_OLDCO|nr:OLC1v1003182C1 [Oldenlandia corymbosa var. corymbosa]
MMAPIMRSVLVALVLALLIGCHLLAALALPNSAKTAAFDDHHRGDESLRPTTRWLLQKTDTCLRFCNSTDDFCNGACEPIPKNVLPILSKLINELPVPDTVFPSNTDTVCVDVPSSPYL